VKYTYSVGSNDFVLVTGAGGFIGGHLVGELLRRGARVRAVDIKPSAEWYQLFKDAQNLRRDLRDRASCESVCKGVAHVFNLAADMGGMGFIETHKADCMLSVLINTHMLMAARRAGVQRYLYASSACVYAAEKQTRSNVEPLRESDAYPAMPEDGYGWEKLFSERMCRHFREDVGLETRVVRYHNVYGPHGTYDGGREKAPAAICRKVIAAQLADEDGIEIWGDGCQTRSFTYIDDCIAGTLGIMASDYPDPLNVGSDQLVSVNELVDIVESCAGSRLRRRYDLGAPKGVRGRNSDNALIKQVLDWSPGIPLEVGIAKTYAWILEQMSAAREAGKARVSQTTDQLV
jgi:GDP-D-mannose 3', 5'-epimerase